MNDFIVWFKNKNSEDYAVISAPSIERALNEFSLNFGFNVIDCHRIDYENQVHCE